MKKPLELILNEENKREVLELASKGVTLVKIREKFGLTQYAWNRLLDEDASFLNSLSRARNDGLEDLADSLLTIADEEPDVNKARLKSDNIKWVLSKRKPQVYGDKLQLDVHQVVDINVALNEARSRASLKEVTNSITNQDLTSIAKRDTDLQSVAPMPAKEIDDIFS